MRPLVAETAFVVVESESSALAEAQICALPPTQAYGVACSYRIIISQEELKQIEHTYFNLTNLFIMKIIGGAAVNPLIGFQNPSCAQGIHMDIV